MTISKKPPNPVTDDWRADWRRGTGIGLLIGIGTMALICAPGWLYLLVDSYRNNKPLLPQMRPGEEWNILASWIFIVLFGVAVGMVATTLMVMTERRTRRRDV